MISHSHTRIRRAWPRFSLALLLFIVFATITPAIGERFPFVISGFDAEPSATDFSGLSPRPAGADGFVRIEDGHFATDAGRLRIWGVNLCFGAIFPTHEEAEKVAAHLAKIGVNGVRIHHHETSFSPHGLYKSDGTWDPQQVDRLDYFLAQLHRHGIYANLNMHVGRSVSQQLGLPSLGTAHYLMRDKHALHFQPEIQQAFWQFCREYLGHVNPYRDRRRADDPAIAMIELCNENKFSEAGPGALLAAPEPYRTALTRQWNKWLVEKYGDTASLRQAWSTGAPVQSRVLASSSQWAADDMGGWRLSDNNGQSPVTMKTLGTGNEIILRVEPQAAAEQAWHQQLTSPTFGMTQDRFYLLTFEARADHERGVGMNVATTLEGKWTPLGLVEGQEFGPEWHSKTFRFQAPMSVESNARLAFDLGGDAGAVEFRNLELMEGGSLVSVPAGQSLEEQNVTLPQFDWSAQSRRDFQQFMVDIETNFYGATKCLLTEELGVRVPITTTQANYQPISITTDVADYVDMHAYWHHPIFPGRSWDPNNWTVQNETMVAFPFDNDWPRVSLMMRSGWRVHGKPFTFSEWNAGEPGFFAADAVPAAAIVASRQDWDAVFFFNYHSKSGQWDSDQMLGYFDFNGQPVKIALVAALANLYRRGDLPPLGESVSVAPEMAPRIGSLALQKRVGVDPDLSEAESFEPPSDEFLAQPQNKRVASPDSAVVWDAREATTAHVAVDTPRTKCLWGLVGQQTFRLGSWQLAFGTIERDYAILIGTARDNQPIERSDSVLVTIVSSAENQEMGWNADRTSVGTDWGHGPTMVNGVPVQLTIPATQRAQRLFALDSQGRRTREVPSQPVANSRTRFELGPQWKTLFYELAR